MTVFVRPWVGLMLDQADDAYIWGAETSFSDPDPDAFDCSELVEWASGRLGLSPQMPDGSWIQRDHCQRYGTLIPINEGVSTFGALLFAGRPVHHVAVSLGDGRTIEARGRLWGTNIFSAYNRGWTWAARAPGVAYVASDEPDPKPVIEKGETVQVGYRASCVPRGAKPNAKGRFPIVAVRNRSNGEGQVVGFNGAKLVKETSSADGHSTWNMGPLAKPLLGIHNDPGGDPKKLIATAEDGGTFVVDLR